MISPQKLCVLSEIIHIFTTYSVSPSPNNFIFSFLYIFDMISSLLFQMYCLPKQTKKKFNQSWNSLFAKIFEHMMQTAIYYTLVHLFTYHLYLHSFISQRFPQEVSLSFKTSVLWLGCGSLVDSTHLVSLRPSVWSPVSPTSEWLSSSLYEMILKSKKCGRIAELSY